MTSAVPCPTYDIILLSRRCPSTGLCFAGKVHIINQPMWWLVCWGKSPCYSQRQIGIHSYIITRTMVAIYCNYDHDQHGDHSCGLHDEHAVMDWSSNSSLGAQWWRNSWTFIAFLVGYFAFVPQNPKIHTVTLQWCQEDQKRAADLYYKAKHVVLVFSFFWEASKSAWIN